MANSVGKFPRDFDPKSIKAVHQYKKPIDKPFSSSVRHTEIESDKYPIPPSPKQPQKSSPFYRGLFWGVTFSFTAAFSAALGAAVTLVNPFSLNLAPVLQQATLRLEKATPKLENQTLAAISTERLLRPVNILVMGIERVPHAPPGSLEAFTGRSDALLLLRFEPTDHSVRILSIPKDSQVEIPGVGFAKINDTNVTGGPALAARVVSKTLNDIPIDRYVRVNSDGFKELVDLVGGVEVFVPYAMSYVDRTQKLEINLQAGWQTLNGEQAEQFARFREDEYGDIGRVERQQTLLKALKNRLSQPAIVNQLPQLIALLQQYVDTNLNWEEMLELANFSQDLKREDIKMVMLAGHLSQKNDYHSGYWMISNNERDRIVKEYFSNDY